MIARLRQFRADCRGSNAVEFAMILPFFSMTVLAAFQVGYIGWAQNRLEGAVREGSRAGVIGDNGGGAPSLTRDQYIRNTVTNAMSAIQLANGGTIEFKTTAYPSYAALNRAGEPFDDVNGNGICDAGETYYDYDSIPGRSTASLGKPGSGGPGDVVKYEVTFPLKLFVPIAGRFFGSNGELDLTSTTVVRNETFGTPATPTTGQC